MRKLLIIILLFIPIFVFGQTHIVYISEKTDSMALISKHDIDIINRVFNEKYVLDSLHNLNEQIISYLESEIKIQDSVILNQRNIIENKTLMINELEDINTQTIETYSKELKKERNKKISFQTMTGAGLIIIILLILV